MVSFIAIPTSSPPFFSRTSLSHLSLPSLSKSTLCKRWVLVPLRCCSSESGSGPELEAKKGLSSSASSLSSSTSMYKWCAVLGSVGFIETAYLTYLKLSNSDAFCPVGGGSCGDVLNSDYATVFGIPLPLFGMVAYGTVAALGLKLTEKNSVLALGEDGGRLVLLGITTSMASASAYFLYILSTNLSGASCTYCLLSAFLSFSLFFITLKDFGFKDIKKIIGLQLCMASLVVVTLSAAYGTSQSVPSSFAETEIPFFTTEITTPSSDFTLSLARHLRSIGAKMYGAFWCSHCLEQKQMFGHDGAKILDYVECFPDGYKKGTKIAKACADVGIEGFPTWVINGEVVSGEVELPELARISGFESNEPGQPS